MIKFNVGCGKRNWPGWVNVDGADLPHIHDHDITLKYQPNDYIDLLYSSHLIAYFDREEAADLLAGWYKKIKPGGVLRLATPDFRALSKLYTRRYEPLIGLLGPMYGKMKIGKQTVYHKTVWDFLSLYYVLVEIGFVDVQPYNHMETEHHNTGDRNDFFDDCSAAYIDDVLISLNMQCVKP